MEKNPFEILGITPELVKKLDNEQLFKLVQSNYRLLQKIFHPDVASHKSSSKANNIAVELNRAFEQLNIKKDGESFETFRKSYESGSSEVSADKSRIRRRGCRRSTTS